MPFEDGYAGVFRVDDTRRLMNIHAGRSGDGVGWTIDPEPISFTAADARVADLAERFEHAYDPRVTWLEDRFYVTWCNGYHGPTIGLAHTTDFRTFTQLDNAFLPFNRNGVLFPRRIGGAYAMLNRPSDGGHTPFGDVFYSESPDLVHWGRHRLFVPGVDPLADVGFQSVTLRCEKGRSLRCSSSPSGTAVPMSLRNHRNT